MSLHHDIKTVTGEEVVLLQVGRVSSFREAKKKWAGPIRVRRRLPAAPRNDQAAPPGAARLTPALGEEALPALYVPCFSRLPSIEWL